MSQKRSFINKKVLKHEQSYLIGGEGFWKKKNLGEPATIAKIIFVDLSHMLVRIQSRRVFTRS